MCSYYCTAEGIAWHMHEQVKKTEMCPFPSTAEVIWHNAVMAQRFKELATSQGYERKRSPDNTFLQEWASTKSERVLNFMYKILINFLLKGVIL